MKKLILILLFIPLVSFGQTSFENGFKEGFVKGYCGESVECVSPPYPVVPMPNLSFNSYGDGFARGIDAGREYKLKRKRVQSVLSQREEVQSVLNPSFSTDNDSYLRSVDSEQEKFDNFGFKENHKYSSDEIFININDLENTFYGRLSNQDNDNYNFLISLSQLHQYHQIQRNVLVDNDFNYTHFLDAIKCAISQKNISYGQKLPSEPTFLCSDDYYKINSLKKYEMERYYNNGMILIQKRLKYLNYKKPLEYLNILFEYSGLITLNQHTHEHQDKIQYTLPSPRIYFKEQEVKIEYSFLPDRVIAKAHSPIKDDVKIIIDMDKWMNLSNPERVWLMIHEYCHEVLGLEHSEGDLEIMFPMMPKNELSDEDIIDYGRFNSYSEGSYKLLIIINELLEHLYKNQSDLIKCASSYCEGIFFPDYPKFKFYEVDDVFNMYDFHVKKKNSGVIYEGWKKNNIDFTKINSKKHLYERISDEAKDKMGSLIDNVWVGHKHYNYSRWFYKTSALP